MFRDDRGSRHGVFVSGTLALSGGDMATAVTEDEDSLKAFIASAAGVDENKFPLSFRRH